MSYRPPAPIPQLPEPGGGRPTSISGVAGTGSGLIDIAATVVSGTTGGGSSGGGGGGGGRKSGGVAMSRMLSASDVGGVVGRSAVAGAAAAASARGSGEGEGGDLTSQLGWQFPGWGKRQMVSVVLAANGELVATADIASGVVDPNAPPAPKLPHASLDQFRATAIAGNDLLSSCLYTAGLCAQYAGKMAPISLALVSFMLYFFRYVYSEVVTALPVNGGSYNALLNTTNKRVAAMAACLSIISYVATAVVSGCTAVQYLQAVWPDANLHAGTVSLLAAFAVLTLAGVGESAAVAVVVFFLHVFTLGLLLGWCVAFGVSDHWATFVRNWTDPSIPYPDILSDTGSLVASGSAGAAIFFGYAAALLGITGFETAANYVEEMRDSRTYVATLRNMWWGAAFFNPLISLLAMAVLPMSTIQGSTADDDAGTTPTPLLATLARKAGGDRHGAGLQLFVCIDGAIVLAGSVLTAYVGVMGLIRRMAQDRCLPSFLMTVNRTRGTPHWVILTFFILTSSLFLLLYPPSTHSQKQVDNLAGVYDIAFLTVMSAFAVAAIILKVKRPDLPRIVITRWPTVFIALGFVLVGLVGNLILSPRVLVYFFIYFGLAAAVVFITFMRARIFKFIFFLVRQVLATPEERARMARRARKLQRVHARLEEVHLAEQEAMAVAAAAARAAPTASLLLPPSRSSMALHVGRHACPSPAALLPTKSGTLPPLAADAAAGGGGGSGRSSPTLGAYPTTLAAGTPAAGPTGTTRSGSGSGSGGGGFMSSLLRQWYGGNGAPEGSGAEAGYGDKGTDTRPLLEGHTTMRPLLASSTGTVAAAEPVPHVPVHDDEEEEDGEEDMGEFGEEPRSTPHAVATPTSPGGGGRVGGGAGGGHRNWRSRMSGWLTSHIRAINSEPVVYFAKDGDLGTLNRVVRYVRSNETSSRIVVVHVMDDREAVQRLAQEMPSDAVAEPRLAANGAEVVYNEAALALVERLPSLSPTACLVRDNVALLDTVYTTVRMDCIIVRGTYFSPHVVQFLARYLAMTPNMMFISMPDARFPFMFSALGGVRVITRSSPPLLRQVQLQRLRIVMHDVATDLEEVSARARRGGGGGGGGGESGSAPAMLAVPGGTGTTIRLLPSSAPLALN